MSSVTVSSYSDLDARTEFVLNRVGFLQSVTTVLQHENTPENTQKVAVWRDNNYIPLIVRSIMDPTEEIYDHAIWATGNLLASDDTRVVTMTRAAITDDLLKRLVRMAGSVPLSPFVRNGILYLFKNFSDYEMPRFFTEAIGGSLLKIMLTDKRGVVTLEARIDFLETVKNIAKKDPSAIDELLLIEALSNPDQSRHHSQLFHIVRTLVEQESMISPLGIDRLMTYFTKQLSASASADNNTNITRHEMLWNLSNIMTEPAAPACFAGEHKELKSLVESIAWDELVSHKEDANNVVGYEALFVLVNYVYGAKHMSEEFQKNVANDDDLATLFGTCMVHDSAKVVAVARQGFDLISQMISTFCPDKYSEVIEEPVVEESVETHWDESSADNTVKSESDTVCEKPVPSASDLVLGARRGNTSAAVRRVVSLLVNSPVGEWIEVPSDWTLTISDLTTLQHLGYTIKDGYVGINPEIYSTH